jgi:serine/threonine-protein kinase
MRVIIEVTAGPHCGQKFCFEGHDTFLVGRSRRAHFRLPNEDRFFSRIHFLVEVNPPHCRLMDMGSKNGTFVNGRQVSLIDLRDGDEIQGGQTVLRVSVDQSKVMRLEEPEAAMKPMVAARMPAQREPLFPVPPDSSHSVHRCWACTAPLTDSGTEGSWPMCQTCRQCAERLPQLIRGYRLIRELGSGDVGATFLSLRESDGRPTALKQFQVPVSPERDPAERFLRQAVGLRLLSHPYIATLQDVGEQNGRLFAAYDYVRGKNLAELVESGPLPIYDGVEIICQVLEALDHAHVEGFMHRGLKPTNVCVTADGMVRLLDYGLSGLYRTSELSGFSLQTRAGDSVPFLAPEQVTAFRQARPFADLYATAALLYFLLTAKHTHDFSTDLRDRVLLMLQEEPIPLRQRRPDVPPRLAKVVHRGLAKDPQDRFPDAASMLQALSNCGT